MNREQLSDAIGRLDESMIEEAMVRHRRRRPWWYAAVAVAACACLAVGMVTVWPLMKPQGNPPPIKPSVSVEGMTIAPTETTVTVMTQPTVKPQDNQPPTKPSVSVNGTTIAPTETIAIVTTQPTVKPTTIPTTGEKPPLPVSFALAQPHYPTITARPYNSATMDNRDAWRADVKAQQDQIKGQTGGMTDYYTATIAQFLTGKAGENRVYSPLNVYLALAMLAETTDGNSRQQVLNLLGVSDLTALRQKCSALWNGVYMDDGAVTSLLANSLWLSNHDYWQYDMDTVNALAQHYYASTFEGEMGSAEYNNALQDWINEQTDNLLKEQAGGLEFDPNTVLALASTICFKARWYSEFSERNNVVGDFATANGLVSVEYMCKKPMTTAYFGDDFTAVSLDLDNGDYQMTFFLPDEGVSVNDLVCSRQVLNLMLGKTGSVESRYLKVNMMVPKFDVVSDQELSDGLKKLGITDVFDSAKSDFGGILTEQNDPMWVSEVKHAARVAIDEEGVTAAAYTVEMKAGSAMPQDEIDFTLDRPFMFAITGPENTILFTGVVENP